MEEMKQSLARILRERLDQFDVPVEVRDAIAQEIVALQSRPEANPHGATVMTPEASAAADLAIKSKRAQPPGPNTPRTM